MNHLEYFLTDNKSGMKSKRVFLQKAKPELLNLIDQFSIENNLSSLPFVEQIFLFSNNQPEVNQCANCELKVPFRSLSKGYSRFCTSKCANNCKEIREKIKQTSLERYGFESSLRNPEILNKVKATNLKNFGVEYPLQSNIVKERVKKTNLERYGVENPKQNEGVKERGRITNLEKYGFEHPQQNEDVKERGRITNLERYGVENPFESEIFKEKIKLTNLEKYGVEFANQNEGVKDKIKITNLERYGVENQFSSDEIKDKIKITNLERYGVENPLKNKDIKDKLIKTQLTKLINTLPDFKFINFTGDSLNFVCVRGHEFIIDRSLLIQRRRFKYNICTICNPIDSHNSEPEKNILKFINELNIFNQSGNRKILNGFELDIYIPSHNLAIEFNGLYWHNELHKVDNYHLNKTLECENKGIKLIHIFEDEWIHKEEIVKSRLKNLLGLTEDRVYARKCKIKGVSNSISREFLNKNHLQGNINSSIQLGLYLNDELVSLMTFGKLRKAMGSSNVEGSFELTRFCNKLNTSVIGGADKLLKHFIKTYKPNQIVSYADRRWSQGDLYEKLGFKFVHNSKPNYWYVKQQRRVYRFKYRKSELIKDGFDPNKSEREIMFDRKIFRIYDCGNKKYVLNLN